LRCCDPLRGEGQGKVGDGRRRPKRHLKAEVAVEDNSWTTCFYPRRCVLITTISEDGWINVAPFSAVELISYRRGERDKDSNLICFSVHPSRHTYGNILQVPEFVLNFPPREIWDKVRKAGEEHDPSPDEVSEVGLTPIPSVKVRPPRVAECYSHIECKVVGVVEAGEYRLVIGRVVAASADSDKVDEAGRFDKLKAHPIIL